MKLNVVSGDYLFQQKRPMSAQPYPSNKKTRNLSNNVLDWRKTVNGTIGVDRRRLQRGFKHLQSASNPNHSNSVRSNWTAQTPQNRSTIGLSNS